MFNRYSQQNRLLERGRRVASPRSFKTDERFESVLGVLLRSGYANAAEVVYDAVYRRANELNPALCLPVLSDIADREEELQRQLAELKKTQVADLGAMKR